MHITDSMFAEEVEKAELPVLIDYWAPWCGPCQMVAPELEKLADQMQGKLKIVKINVDENRKTAEKFNIMSIPTLMLFKNGAMVKKMVGAMSAPQILSSIESEI